MGPEKRIKIALLFVLFFLCVGTVGYVLIEGYSAIDALYMTVITVSTVGFGEVHTLSDAGRGFTVVLILFSIGSLAILAGAFSEMLIESSVNPNRWKNLMEKKIAKLQGHVIICGHGRVGKAAAQHFRNKGYSFVVLEQIESEVKNIRDMGFHVLEGDGTREECLMKANIKKASSLLAVMNSDPENLYAVLTARELNPTLQIIARSEDVGSESRMLRAGADSIIAPFTAAGIRVAEKLMSSENDNQTGVAEGERPEPVLQWRNMAEDDPFCGLPVAKIEEMLGESIAGLRSKGVDHLQPGPGLIVTSGDELLVLGRLSGGAERPTARKKIGIIDDNPVIVRLYTRLFQKAGFLVVTAETGGEGLKLVQKEQPDALVVDYHLPDMTGVELCGQVRRSLEESSMKIFLFTADDQEKVKAVATSAGIDKVVIKSPNAGEIVSLVSSELL